MEDNMGVERVKIPSYSPDLMFCIENLNQRMQQKVKDRYPTSEIPNRENIRNVILEEVHQLNTNPEPLTRLIVAFRQKLNYVLSV